MSPAHERPFEADHTDRSPINPSLVTAVQVVTAWLIAFVCLALIALLS